MVWVACVGCGWVWESLCVCEVCICVPCVYRWGMFVYGVYICGEQLDPRTNSSQRQQRDLDGRKVLPVLSWENHHLPFYCRYQWQQWPWSLMPVPIGTIWEAQKSYGAKEYGKQMKPEKSFFGIHPQTRRVIPEVHRS